jgi:glycosyltransferase involved in cell wall biosynthesis
MKLYSAPKSLYVAFDVYPAAKGSATHIRHFYAAMKQSLSPSVLYTLGNETQAVYEQRTGEEVVRFRYPQAPFFERVDAFQQQLFDLLHQSAHTLAVCHFRDVWGGMPVLLHRARSRAAYRTVFEVNALMSIELPYRFPEMSEALLKQIETQELWCLQQSDHIVTPSYRLKEQLLQKASISPEKISVIQNGAEVNIPPMPRMPDAPLHYFIYFGATQPWQGIEELLRAFRYVHARYPNLHLVMCLSSKEKKKRQWVKLSRKLGLAEAVVWRYELPQSILYRYVQHAIASIAPLTACRRNMEQGACPLKIIESMAMGVPVIASDLPIVREIMQDEQEGLLVRAGRPALLARQMQRLYESPSLRLRLAQQARRTATQRFNWEEKKQALQAVYQSLLTSSAQAVFTPSGAF